MVPLIRVVFPLCASMIHLKPDQGASSDAEIATKIQERRVYQKRSKTMKKNMATLDRIIRAIIAVIIAVLYFTGQISGAIAILLGIVAIVLLLTSIIGSCPLYLLLGISTKKSQ